MYRLVQALHHGSRVKHDDHNANPSQLPPSVEQAMLEILNRRFETGDDSLADAFRRFIRRRR